MWSQIPFIRFPRALYFFILFLFFHIDILLWAIRLNLSDGCRASFYLEYFREKRRVHSFARILGLAIRWVFGTKLKSKLSFNFTFLDMECSGASSGRLKEDKQKNSSIHSLRQNLSSLDRILLWSEWSHWLKHKLGRAFTCSTKPSSSELRESLLTVLETSHIFSLLLIWVFFV